MYTYQQINQKSLLHKGTETILIFAVITSVIFFGFVTKESEIKFLKSALFCSTLVSFWVYLASLCSCQSTANRILELCQKIKEGYQFSPAIRKAGRAVDNAFALLLFAGAEGFTFSLLAVLAPQKAVFFVMLTMAWVIVGPMCLVMYLLKDSAQWPTLVESYPFFLISFILGFSLFYYSHSAVLALSVSLGTAGLFLASRHRLLPLFIS